MQKTLFVCLALIACVFGKFHFRAIKDDVNTTDAQEFFTGFSGVFGLQAACADLIECTNTTNSPIFDDIKTAIDDLKAKNISGAFDELMEFFKGMNNLRNVCSSAVDPYDQVFGNAVKAYDTDKAAFDDQVAKNLASNATGTFKDTAQLAIDLHQDNYQAAGADFGDLAQIGLKTWINESSVAVDDFFDAVAGITNGDSDDDSSETSATEFFEGFATALGLQAAGDALIKCVQTDPSNLFNDINKLITDLQNSNWGDVAADGIAIFEDIQDMQSDCPDGANPFINEFQPAVNAFNNNNQQFLDTVGDNFKHHLGDTMGDIGQMIQDFDSSDYSDAGEQFGNLLVIGLQGYLPNSTLPNS